MFEIDQTSFIDSINSPLLVIQAGRDKSVSAESAAAQTHELLETRSNITFNAYPALDHSFNNLKGRNEVQRVIEDIKVWLLINGHGNVSIKMTVP
jgi:dienelactone hydrolase